MVSLSDRIDSLIILPHLKVNSKKQLFHIMAEKASEITGVSDRVIFDKILQRERLGSTNIGEGVALPHAKLSSIDTLIGIFTRLEEPIDFESTEERPIDLIFLLLAPDKAGADHLKALSSVTRTLQDPDNVSNLRKTSDSETIYKILSNAPSEASLKPISIDQ